jgi:hypothetical protein
MLPVTEIPDRIFILPGFYVYKDHESLVVVCVLEKRRARNQQRWRWFSGEHVGKI